jgi:hypothetical protein
MDEHVLPVVKHEFPLQVVIGNEVVTFNSAEDIPAGAQFKIYVKPEPEVVKAAPKIINTGKARTWNNNAVD